MEATALTVFLGLAAILVVHYFQGDVPQVKRYLNFLLTGRGADGEGYANRGASGASSSSAAGATDPGGGGFGLDWLGRVIGGLPNTAYTAPAAGAPLGAVGGRPIQGPVAPRQPSTRAPRRPSGSAAYSADFGTA